MPTPQQANLNIPNSYSPPTSEQSMANFQAVQMWANQNIPIFPVYRFRQNQSSTQTWTNTNNAILIIGGRLVELEIQKKFDWTVLNVQINFSNYMTVGNTYLDLNACLNFRSASLVTRTLTRTVFNSALFHMHSLGRVYDPFAAPAGAHTISVLTDFTAGAGPLAGVYNVFDLTVQEQPPFLNSGERW